MPLSIAVQKDIGEYREKILFGLSARQMVSMGGGIAGVIAEGVIGVGVMGGELDNLFIAMCVTLTLAFLLGFVNPYGLKFSLAARLYLNQWVGATKLIYKSSVFKRSREAAKGAGEYGEYRYYKRACANSTCP